MKKSKISILLLFLVMILAISAVSAADTNDTSDSVAQAVDEAPVDEVASADVDNVVSTDSAADVLADPVVSTSKNFTELKNDIASSYGYLPLAFNYVRVAGEEDIEITSSIVIAGNDEYYIDANSLGGIFKITNKGSVVVLNNVILKNGNSTNGGAIYNEGTLTISSSQLTNNNASSGGAIYNVGHLIINSGSALNGNTATNQGGAIYSKGTTTIETVTFENNKITTGSSYAETQTDKCNGGGAIYNEGSLTATDSTFTKNTAPHDTEIFSAGGAIYNIGASEVLVDDCTFTENSAVYSGAIMFEQFSQDTVAVKNSRFNGNKAWQGGAIYGNDLVGSLIITGSNFTANKAVGPNSGQASPCGGAIMVGTKSYTGIALDIDGCNFVENDGGYMGGAIASSPDNTIKVADSNFTGNTATTLGGAIVTGTGTDLTVSGSTFTNNKVSAGMGGAIFAEPNSKNNITGSTFTNNVDRYPVAIMNYQGNLELSGNTFDDNSVYNYGGTITSQIKVTVLGNTTTSTTDGTITLNATVTDDNDNFIRDSSFNFVIDGKRVEATIDAANKIYTATYTILNPGIYTVGATSTKGEEYIVKNGTVKNYRGTFTDLQTKVNGCGGQLVLNYDFTYTPELDDSSYITGIYVINVLNVTGNGYTISGNGIARIFDVRSTTLNLTNVILSKGNATNGSAIHSTGNLNLNGVTFSENVAVDCGGAIYNNKGTVNIEDCVFDKNDLTNRKDGYEKDYGGAAIYSVGGTLNINGSKFTNNLLNYYPGENGENRDLITAAITSSGVTVINNTAFENNSGCYGADLMVFKSSKITGPASLTIDNSNFTNTRSYAGGIQISKIDFNITNSNFNNCIAYSVGTTGYTASGGALFAVNCNNGIIKNTNFTNCGNTQGGAIDIEKTKSLLIDGCTFENNSVSTQGGALAIVQPAGDVTITNTDFINNSAKNAGAIYYWTVSDNKLTISDCEFENNSATDSGAAVYALMYPAGSVNVSNSNFTNNNATKRGGVIFFYTSGSGNELTISNSNFTDNSAATGEAIYTYPKTVTKITDSNFTNNGETTDYAIYNQGTLELSKNTISNLVYSSGTITSTVKGKVLNGTETVYASSENVEIYAVVTDDNGNLINDPNFVFEIYDSNGLVKTVNATFDGEKYVNTTVLAKGYYTVKMTTSKYTATIEDGKLAFIAGTYTDLQMKIDAAIAAGQELDLTYDFAYDATIDGASFINGVIINEEITINGNDHSIDGSKTARIFYIGTFADATINGIVFKNGTADKGGALFVAGKLDIDNCTFIDNVATTSGSDIYIMTSSVVVVNGEESYNYLLNDPDSSLNKYYNDNPIEDGIDANGNPVHDSTTPIVGHSWESAITTWMDNVIIDGVTYKWEDGYSKFPWILINTNDFTGYIEFWYDGELKFNWTGNTNRERGVVSVLADLGMPDYSLTYQYGTVRDKVFDPSLLTVKYVGTTGGRPVTMISTTSDSVTIKNSVFNGDGNSIYNLGKLALENNTVKGIIYNNGTITSQVNSTILNNETIETADYSYKLNATLTDDNGNKINDPKLKFKVNDVEVAAIYDEANGVYTYDAYPIDFEPKYVVDVTTTNENKLSTKKGVIINLKYGTFTDLQAKIADAIANHKVLNLTYDFTYTAGVDDTLKEGIDIGSDLTINGNGTIISGNNAARIFNVANGATLTLNNATLTNGNATNGSAINSNGNLELNGVTFSDNVAVDCGGAIYNNKGTVKIEDCVFDKNDLTNRKDGYTKDYGGAAIYSVGGTLNINGSKFTNNLLNYYPGDNGQNRDLITAAITSSGVTIINNTVFENNSGCYGADIMVFKSSKITDPASLTIDNSNFTNTRSYAGGIQIAKIDFNITNSNFDNNIAYSVGSTGYTASGGALFATNCNNGIIKDSNFTNCGNTQGGAIDIEKTKSLLIDGCLFENNAVSAQGGAIAIVYPSGDVTITNTDFINNTAKNAAAVYFATQSDNKLTISDCEFEDNSATASGAAVYALMYPNGSVDISNSNFTNNNATNKAGAIFFYTSGSDNELTVSNCNFTDNSAAAGEAVYTYPNTVTKITDSTFANNGEATDYTIYNKGTLELTRTTVDNLVYSSGTFNTELNATFLNNKTWNDTGLGDIYTLNATLTDANGNKIYDPSFRFTVDGTPIEDVPLYDETTGVYTVGYYMKTAGLKVVSTNYTADNLEIFTGALYIEPANVTEFTVSPGGQGNRIPYGENVTVYVGLYGVNDEGLNETFTVIVNNTEYTVTVVNGTGSFNVSGLEPGDYSAQAIFDSNPNYNKAYASGVFSVLRPDRTLSIAVENVEFGETAIVNITINKGDESDIGVVVLNINGTEYTVSVEGNASIEIPGLPVGTHVINATLIADGLDDAVVNDTVNITVADDHEVTVVAIANKTISYGENLTVEIDKISSSGLEKVITGNATIYIYDGDDSTVEPVIAFPCNVGEDGVAVDFKGLPVGNYMIIVDFDSADGYYAGQATTYATVTKAQIPTFIVETTGAGYGSNATINVTIIGVNGEYLNGTAYITINSELVDNNVTIENGRYVKNVTGAAGTYTVNVYFVEAKGNYENASSYDSFEIIKTSPTLDVNDTEVVYGEDIEIPFTITGVNGEGIDGTVLAVISGPEEYGAVVYDKNTGKGTISFNLKSGEQKIFVTFLSNDGNYLNAGKEISLNVTQANITIDSQVTSTDSVFGIVNATLNVTGLVNDDTLEAIVSVFKDGKELYNFSATLGKEEYIIFFGLMTPGVYNYTIAYDGMGDYAAAEFTKGSFTIEKVTPEIELIEDEINITIGETAEIEYRISPLVISGNVTLWIDDKEYYNEEFNGTTGSILILANYLNVSKAYNIKVQYIGDDKYDNSNVAELVINVAKIDVADKITIEGSTVTYGENATVTVQLPSDAEGNVTVTIDGVGKFNATVESGFAVVEIPGLGADIYELFAVEYSGDGRYTSHTGMATVEVKQAKSSVVIKPIEQVAYGNNVTIEYTVLNATTIKINVATEDLEPVCYITFDANVSEYPGSIEVPNLAAGKYIVVVENDGNDNYTFSAGSAEFEVIKATPEISAEALDILYGQTTTVTVTVSPNATGTVSIIVNGKKYTADIEGTTATATIEAADIVLGENNVNVIFDGDGNYTMNYNSTTFMAYDNVVTNDTFFRYFDEDGILLDTVPFDELIFKGEFADLGITHIFVDNVDITGEDALLNNIGFVINDDVSLSDMTLVADKSIGQLIYVSGDNVVIRGMDISYTVGNNESSAIYVYDSENVNIVNNEIVFESHVTTDKEAMAINVLESSDVVISNNNITASLPAINSNWGLYYSYGMMGISDVHAVKIMKSEDVDFTKNNVITFSNEYVLIAYSPTIESVLIVDSDIVNVDYNNFTVIDEETPIGSPAYLYALTMGIADDAVISNNNFNMATDGGVDAMGSAYAIQFVTSNVDIIGNNITSVSNGPNLGIYVSYSYDEDYMFEEFEVNIINNNIDVTGYAANTTTWNALLTGIEAGVGDVTISENTINVHNKAGYIEGAYVYGISYAQSSFAPSLVIENNDVIVEDGDYAVSVNFDVDTNVTNNYLIAHKLYGDEAVHVEGEAVVKDNFPAKLNLTISVEDIKVGEDAIATITANELFNGEVILTWGIEEIPVTLTDGIGSFSLGKLPADVYNVGVYYDGSSYFPADENTTNFTVSKFASQITIKTSDVVVDQNVGVTIIIPGATGNITLDIDGNIQELALENGVATATIEKIASGEHYITVAYDGDDNLDGNQSTYEFNVSKSSDYLFEAGLLENAVEVYETAYVIVTLPDDASDKIKVYVNGNLTAQADANRTVSIPLNILPSGNYTITVTYADAKYDEKSIELNLTVERASPELYVEVEDITVADVAVIHVYADELFNGTVTVYIGNEAEPLKLTDGYANLTLGKLPAENYTVQVKFAGDDLFTADDDEDEFTVSKLETEFIITFDTPVVDEDLTINISLPGVSDKITLIVDGYNNTVTLEDGKGSLTIPKANMTAGGHYFTAIFDGNGDYEPAEEFETFTIEKQEDYPFDVNLTIDEITVGENLTFNVTLPEDANGIVNVTVDDELVASVNVVNGKATVTIPASEFTSGEYNTIEVTYADDKYGETTVEKDIYVNKLVANLTISADNITIGENAVLIVTIPGAPESTYVTVELLGEVYDLFLIGGKDSVSVSGLGEGTYTAYVFIEDDPVYDDATAEVTFSVTKVDIPAEDAFNVTTPENATAPEFKVTLPEDATGYLLLDINGTQTFVPLVNGTATARVPEGFAPGNYSATVTYTGDDKYDPITTTQNITVASNVPDNAFTIPDTAKDGEPLTYAINLPSDAKGYLEVDVDGTKHVAALVNGSASITVPGLSAGNHNVTVSYTGDGKYSPVTKSVAMNVPAPVYKITNNNNVAAIYSANANYKVLITKDGKAVGAGESVNIVFNGKTYTVKTDSKGYATLNLNTKVKVKTYTVTAEYKGVKVSNKVTIKHVIKAKNVSVKKSKKVNKIKVKTNKVNGKFLKGKKLTLKIKGKKIKAKINKKGVATFKVKKSVLKKLKVGKKYKYTVTYGKDKVTKKLKVKR